jgi:hopanoid biosynthesis associated radical SAM protein HpnJ
VRTLFLNPPSFEGFDGGGGARYQARREIRSFWYPTWLAQVAAMVPDSRLIDAPARGLSLGDILPIAGEYDFVVIHTSTPSFASDVKVAEALKAANPGLLIGFVGPHVMVSPGSSLLATEAVDFVAGGEFDHTIREVASGIPLEEVDGLSYKANGRVAHNRCRAPIEDMDSLPHVVDVYRRDLVIEDYFIGYLLHPYISLYTGRGCRSQCTFCLWPQTISGHRYRTRSPENVAEEIAKAVRYFPQAKEIFFDDDTFTDDLPRAEAIAVRMGKMGVTWSCSAKAIVPHETLRIMRNNGLRLLMVGYESGCQEILNNIRKGTRIDVARRFTADCHKLGIAIHGTFVVGLPGETDETIERTIRFAREINPHTIQISLPAVYPGTELYHQAVENGWLVEDGQRLVGEDGAQLSSLSYPHLPKEEIFRALETFYRRFYFRPGKIMEFVSEMARSPQMMKRRLREGREFFRFLSSRERKD